jgi:hypothetical protein
VAAARRETWHAAGVAFGLGQAAVAGRRSSGEVSPAGASPDWRSGDTGSSDCRWTARV